MRLAESWGSMLARSRGKVRRSLPPYAGRLFAAAKSGAANAKKERIDTASRRFTRPQWKVWTFSPESTTKESGFSPEKGQRARA